MKSHVVQSGFTVNLASVLDGISMSVVSTSLKQAFVFPCCEDRVAGLGADCGHPCVANQRTWIPLCCQPRKGSWTAQCSQVTTAITTAVQFVEMPVDRQSLSAAMSRLSQRREHSRSSGGSFQKRAERPVGYRGKITEKGWSV